MSNTSPIPALPRLSPAADLNEIRDWLQKYYVQNQAREPSAAGDQLTKFVTRGELVGLDVIHYTPGQGVGGGSGGTVGGGPGSDPPSVITGLTVTAALSHFIVQFDPPVYQQGGGNAYTEIFAANYAGTGPLPTFANAVKVATVTGTSTIIDIPAQPGQETHFWAGAVTVGGIRQVDGVGPTGGLNGVSAKTGQDVTSMLDALTAAALDPNSPYHSLALRADLFTVVPHVDYYQDTQPTATAVGQTWYKTTTKVTKVWDGVSWNTLAINPPFFVSTTTITNNGVSCPPGVYITDAFIQNGDITNAKIGNLAVDDAKVANMSVSKLVAGSLAVGEYIQSTGYVGGSAGFKIEGNGNAEFNNIVARGSIYANGGTIGGASIGASFVQSNNYVANTQGWRLDNTAGKVFANSILIRNAAGDRLFDLDATTTASVLKIGTAIDIKADGTATFGGTLTAANIVGTSQLQTDAVTAVQVTEATALSFTTTGVHDLVSTAITTTGQKVLLQGFVMVNAASNALTGTTSGSIELRILRDGTQIWSSGSLAMQHTWDDTVSNYILTISTALSPIHVDPTPTAAAHTYKLQVNWSLTGATANNLSVACATLVATEIKR